MYNTEMIQTFGDFIENLKESEEYLILGFSPTSFPLKQRWRNNGLSADFLADYLTTFFPRDETENGTVDKQAEIKSAVSYIANELLENAMKFSDETSSYPITIKLHLLTDKMIFQTCNSLNADAKKKFQSYIQQLLSSDPDELYINQLEKIAESESDEAGSGLGFLTMINDYMAQVGWRFDTVDYESKPVITVTTMVQLSI